MACAPSASIRWTSWTRSSARPRRDGVAATDLNLLVRLRVSSDHAKLSLAAKFGAEPHEVKPLLFAARQAADALGICFHVGSQAMSPAAYAEAMARVRDAIVEAAVTVDIVDVGGGFPSAYPGMEPPPLEAYFAVIHAALRGAADQLLGRTVVRAGPRLVRRICAAWSSASRSAAATSCTSTTAPMARCSTPRTSAGAIRSGCCATSRSSVRPMEFSFYGPTCDDLDHMAGPFELPGDVGAGDYIEIGMLGAYGCAMRTGFNGFGVDSAEIVDDEPMASLYGAGRAGQAFERREAVARSRRLPLRRARDPAVFLQHCE